ncbi:MAG: TetR/AcrR family transcriptional regulator [Actinobacteria bacterium]|nr:TetR/AcrR family transcriptional regulator [Actinomycetota bacterium]MBU1944713.1 TetR/AcrR family transcriptional regulator [Actinomycetota bacterium]MBU2688029.1 TetR/AcrR family transcriptional regulator [Actinomycetota bacterium]
MRPDSKREQILRAAEEVFAEKGFKGATVREIAERVDIRTPGLYYHFSNKQEIYDSMIRNIYEGLGSKILEPMAGAEGIEAKVSLMVDLLMEYWAEHPMAPRIIAQETLLFKGLLYDELIPQVLAPMFEGMLGPLEDEAGPAIRDLDLSLLVYNVFGLTVFYFFAGHVLTMITGVDSFAPERLRTATGEIKDLVFEGIRA